MRGDAEPSVAAFADLSRRLSCSMASMPWNRISRRDPVRSTCSTTVTERPRSCARGSRRDRHASADPLTVRRPTPCLRLAWFGMDRLPRRRRNLARGRAGNDWSGPSRNLLRSDTPTQICKLPEPPYRSTIDGRGRRPCAVRTMALFRSNPDCRPGQPGRLAKPPRQRVVAGQAGMIDERNE